MQKLDRIKVRHAKDNFFNADIGTLLPSIDTAYASNSTPQPNMLHDSKDFGASMISTEREIVTSAEIKGHCERFAAQPSQRQRIIITRSQEPRSLASRNDNQGMTDRPLLGNLENQATLDKLNETYHFANSSKMSIQPGKLQQNTVPVGYSFDQRAHLSTNLGLNPKEGAMVIDVQTPQLPDAMARIRQRNSSKKAEDADRKKRMVEQFERSRAEVLDQYNIKTMH